MDEEQLSVEFTIGVLLATPSGGGALAVVTRLTPLLEAEGISVKLLVSQDLTEFLLRTGIQTKRVILPRARLGSLNQVGPAVLGLPWVLRSIIIIRREARCRPGLVLLPFLTGTALITLVATLGLPNPVIVCERNDPSRQRHGWHAELLKRLLYPRATAITVNAPSRAARDHLVRVSRGLPVHFVPNPRPKGMAPADVRSSRVILSVGRLVPQKNHATLIEAFAQIHERIPEWSLRIAGDGPLREPLNQLIDRLGLRQKVELVRHADDVGQLYASAGLFVLPSDYEGTSNALLEAASAGLPCIVTEEAAPPQTACILMHVPAGSPEALAARMLEACTDSDRRAELGLAANRWVHHVSDDDVLAKWIDVLRSSASEKR